MTPKRLISDENKKSSESASVNESQPSTSGFTGITQDILMDDDSSSSSSSSSSSPPFSHPLLHYPSPVWYIQKKKKKKDCVEIFINLRFS
ncbi:hypothetical protein E2C01_042971 [Portunus trituberculatus]|uniref:Uncharacterized protein n=1 Tax=Portunus trituberculatus TaxID=210409 RepID=A0A5B7FUF3_PORTR|nr:hypothetical protein [Portunus trituberculatus]